MEDLRPLFVALLLGIATLLLAILINRRAKPAQPQPPPDHAQVLRERAAIRRPHSTELQSAVEDALTDDPAHSDIEEEQNSDHSEGDDEKKVNIDGKLTREQRKAIAKAQKKRDKKAYFESLEMKNKEKDEKRDKYWEKQREKQAEWEEKEREEQERIERMEREKRDREQAEFNKWRKSMKVEESGSQEDLLERDGDVLQRFVEFVKTRKTVLLEELAVEFSIPAKTCAERLVELEKDGFIQGVLDDRGKYIYVTNEEFKSLADFVQRKGRLTTAQFASECNRVINLERHISEGDPSLESDDELEMKQ
eukprot:TRINITY_DN37426_c0_g1_i4.p2 TRINITY_DN37426_c0_g1~~TRINITY_DN37426_c0_g1_i4.p2  ORF type:complete len:308 (-),score=87.86 TRINITY_DN37426_c0_g1_i4:126-1049(-)